MSLLDMQRALCRLLVDREFRIRFVSNSAEALRHYTLSTDERNSLNIIDIDRVAAYSTLVIDGRIGLALKAFPITRGLLPPDFVRRFGDEFHRVFPPCPERGSLMFAEVQRLFEFLKDPARWGETAAPYLWDVLQYEYWLFVLSNSEEVADSAKKFQLRNERNSRGLSDEDVRRLKPLRGPHSVVVHFSHDVRGVISAMNGGKLLETRQEEHPFLLVKRYGEREVRVIRVNELTEALLLRCDGNVKASSLMEELWCSLSLSRELRRDEFERNGAQALRRLADLDVISVR